MAEYAKEHAAMGVQDPLVSIIVPTYNEANDVRRTLNALVAQTYGKKEILVIDDSTDDTPSIIQEYASQGVILMRPRVRRGRCEARNLGILSARGDIIVILNADVFPDPDFLERILGHYRRGADYVLVESQVANTGALLPRYLECLHQHAYAGTEWIEWTEGFSCRRAAALDVGLFPETPVPICAGEDGYFAARLARKYRKVIDRSIVVRHVAPESVREFWGQRVGRGQASPQYFFFLDHQSLLAIVARVSAKTLRAALVIVCVAPALLFCMRLCRYSPRRQRDLPGFCAAFTLSLLAQVRGEWLGVHDVVRYLLSRRRGAIPAPERASQSGESSGDHHS
jgi:glycosyltransferase involved in cell wall biosynthesis